MPVADLEAMCVGAFPASVTRGKIMDGLKVIVERLCREGVEAQIWVNGSFLTHKPDRRIPTS
jgi:hypothetical protein